MDMIPKVLQSVAGQNFTVYIYFHDGTVRLLNAAPLVQKGGVFAPLQDADFFRDRLTILNDTVAWDVDGTRDPCTCVDLDPCELYESCPVVEDLCGRRFEWALRRKISWPSTRRWFDKGRP